MADPAMDETYVDAELAAAIERRTNGEPVVLLAVGNRYCEVVKKEGDDVTVAFPNRYATLPLAQLEAEGFKAMAAKRVIKANGTWMYAVVKPEGTDWYIAGEYHPAVRRKK